MEYKWTFLRRKIHRPKVKMVILIVRAQLWVFSTSGHILVWAPDLRNADVAVAAVVSWVRIGSFVELDELVQGRMTDDDLKLLQKITQKRMKNFFHLASRAQAQPRLACQTSGSARTRLVKTYFKTSF